MAAEPLLPRRTSAERATAADRPGVAQPVPERPVPTQPWPRIVGAAFLVFAVLLGGWELYWRSQQAVPGYRDDEALWAIQWRRVQREHDATVLTGASRTFFDVQLPVWERLGGRRPIQLAAVGTSPTRVLELLADETSFRGRVLVGVAPNIFFSGREYQKSKFSYWRTQSPSERVGKWLSMRVAEPWLAFYDDDFALFNVFARQPWPNRAGKPTSLRVRKLSVTDADRNNRMWERVVDDTEYRDLARRTWAEDFTTPTPAEAARNAKALEEAISRATKAVATLRARGVQVLFVREPSTDDFLAYENLLFPRRQSWDVLLARTGAPGIHFEDYAELRTGYSLPEWSHMDAESAERYTAALYRIIDREYGAPTGTHW